MHGLDGVHRIEDILQVMHKQVICFDDTGVCRPCRVVALQLLVVPRLQVLRDFEILVHVLCRCHHVTVDAMCFVDGDLLYLLQVLLILRILAHCLPRCSLLSICATERENAAVWHLI